MVLVGGGLNGVRAGAGFRTGAPTIPASFFGGFRVFMFHNTTMQASADDTMPAAHAVSLFARRSCFLGQSVGVVRRRHHQSHQHRRGCGAGRRLHNWRCFQRGYWGGAL
jgi:hypothetical protein